MRHNRRIDKLAKFLAYMLGRRPDEFGLVPDTDGYVKLKDLLKAMAEEPGWRHVRMNHIREVVFTGQSPPIEIADNRVRAIDRAQLLIPTLPEPCPKLLYYSIRQRAYPVILEKGRMPNKAGTRIVFAVDREFAKRLGRRIDPSPIILVVHTVAALANGATLWRFGEHLFLSDCLPLDSFSGPPPPKKRPTPQKPDPAEARPEEALPGSYLLDLSDSPPPQDRSKKPSRRRKNEWKRERKQKNRRR